MPGYSLSEGQARQSSPGAERAEKPDDALNYLEEETLANLRLLLGDEWKPLLAELMELYLSSTPELIKAIQNAVVQSDPAGIRLNSHSLKSSSAQLGIPDLPELSAQIEVAGEEDAVAKADALLPELLACYAQVEEKLEQIVDFLKAGETADE